MRRLSESQSQRLKPNNEVADSHRSFSSLLPWLLKALKPATNSWKSTVPPPLQRKKERRITSASIRTRKGGIHPCATRRRCSCSLFVKDGNHPQCEWVVGDRGDLQELVLVDGTRAIAVEFHEPFLQALDFRSRDCKWTQSVPVPDPSVRCEERRARLPVRASSASSFQLLARQDATAGQETRTI